MVTSRATNVRVARVPHAACAATDTVVTRSLKSRAFVASRRVRGH
jgi:hypothetical protein